MHPSGRERRRRGRRQPGRPQRRRRLRLARGGARVPSTTNPLSTARPCRPVYLIGP
jgi:hypothetical protein